MSDGADNPFMARIHGPTFPESEVRRDLLVREFLQERCLFQQDYRQPIRALGQEWESWLVIQGAPWYWRRAFSQTWLKDRLERRLSYHLLSLNGRHQVAGLLLRSAVGDDVPSLPTEKTWRGLQSAPPEIASAIPLVGATATRRPPDEEIVRRFLDACCTVKAPPESVWGVPERLLLKQQGRESFTRIATAFADWLVQQQVAPSLRRLCNARWLHHQFTLRGHTFAVVEGGYVAVYGIQLRPERYPNGLPPRRHFVRAASSSSSEPSSTPLAPRLSRSEQKARHAAYLARLERAARAAAGMPVDDSAYEKAHAQDTPASLRQDHQERMGAQVEFYLDLTLVADPDASLSLHDLKRGFSNFLLNQSVSDLGSDTFLRGELARRGITPSSGRQERLRRVLGYRFRTPEDDPLPC